MQLKDLRLAGVRVLTTLVAPADRSSQLPSSPVPAVKRIIGTQFRHYHLQIDVVSKTSIKKLRTIACVYYFELSMRKAIKPWRLSVSISDRWYSDRYFL